MALIIFIGRDNLDWHRHRAGYPGVTLASLLAVLLYSRHGFSKNAHRSTNILVLRLTYTKMKLVGLGDSKRGQTERSSRQSMKR